MSEALKGGQLRFFLRVDRGRFTRTDMEKVLHPHGRSNRLHSGQRSDRPPVLPVWVTRFRPGLDTLESVGEEPVVEPE